MKYSYDGPTTSVQVSRRINATPERVFDAWIDPAVACKWLFTTKTSKTTYDLDVRVGGAFTITRERAGKQYVAIGTYLVIDRPHRLVFTYAMPQYAGDIDTVTVEITPDGDGCIVALTHEIRPGYERSTEKGWVKMFDLLERQLNLS